MTIKEVASPIDLRKAADALEWAEEVNMKRPWRYEFLACMWLRLSHSI